MSADPPIVPADVAGLPALLAADLLEAAACSSFGAYRAAGLLARRTVEQVVVMRRVPLDRRTLQQKVGWLLSASHLHPSLTAEARTVRDVGTAAAHGAGALTAEEAEAVVKAALAIARAVVLRNG